ncbi:YueI family protein [Lacticaseibacillus parakribbianus]|uniref:YueI family protein n=1 Tax=Lacticaseibacillus parakribbianus TaxID=2970927 RepID=UPI0021CAE880|nr:YueI family protein [Lacticaseibacillus parakribbianus]
MPESLNDFIKAKALGIPTLHPDEKRAFLGNFKERVAMAVTIRQLHDPRIADLLDSVLTRYPGYRVYLNGLMMPDMIDYYLKQALAHDYPFTIMAQPGMRVKKGPHAADFGWVLAHPTEKITRPILI